VSVQRSLSSVRQTAQMPSVGPRRNCQPVGSRFGETSRPSLGCDRIAAARRGAGSSVPAVAMDAVNTN
jgi:hypothetical protein